MARTADAYRLRDNALNELLGARARYADVRARHGDDLWPFQRWIAKMIAAEVWSIWERYAEDCLAVTLNRSPKEYLASSIILPCPAKAIPLKKAYEVIRSGRPYFDFRSTAELQVKANSLLGPANSPFRTLRSEDAEFLDSLAAIRNCIVHQSEASTKGYRRALTKLFGVKSKPGPEEFLHAKDQRPGSATRGQHRLLIFIDKVESAINMCPPSGAA